MLDAILAGYVEQDLDAAELVAPGYPPEEVERVIAMVDRAEYKRRQAPPGIRISTKAFGRDRRLPITNRYESRARSRAPACPRAAATQPARAEPPSSRGRSAQRRPRRR